MLNTDNFNALPPELQQRIAAIMSNQAVDAAQAAPPAAPAPAPEPAPVQKPPSLMDHTLALRQEVSSLRQELRASSQVLEAVGQAVGQLYQMFCQQTETTDYSATLQTQQDLDGDY